MIKKRMIISLISGAILGIFCVIGANIRFGGELSDYYIFGFWFNRLLMGFVFGLFISNQNWKTRVLRGITIGLLVSFAFYSATEFLDPVGFAVGALYGVIIETVAYKLDTTFVNTRLSFKKQG